MLTLLMLLLLPALVFLLKLENALLWLQSSPGSVLRAD
jgi:hypothetical protein